MLRPNWGPRPRIRRCWGAAGEGDGVSAGGEKPLAESSAKVPTLLPLMGDGLLDLLEGKGRVVGDAGCAVRGRAEDGGGGAVELPAFGAAAERERGADGGVLRRRGRSAGDFGFT